jgi:hypothetical protein
MCEIQLRRPMKSIECNKELLESAGKAECLLCKPMQNTSKSLSRVSPRTLLENRERKRDLKLEESGDFSCGRKCVGRPKGLYKLVPNFFFG